MAQVEDLKVSVKVDDKGATQVIEKIQNQLKGLERAANKASTSGIEEVARSVRSFDASGKKNIETLRGQVTAMKALREQAIIGSSQFKALTADINRYSAALNKAEGGRPKGGRLANLAKGAGAIAAGGVFGGPEGAIGGAAGLALGGPAGAAVGAAIGAQIGQLRQALGVTAEYAAELKKLRIALLGVTTSQEEYGRALSFIQETTKTFAIPQRIVTRQFTKLQASVQGAGGNLEDTKTAFNGIVAAVRATGGSLADVDAALTATAQVFSKGKVSAEELRQQIGERLPGAFTLFAESMGLTPAELDKALEKGKVTLEDFQVFAEALFKRYGKTAEIIAKAPESAGDRLRVALEKMNESVGKILQPIGAAFQDVFTGIVNVITRAANALDNFLGISPEKKLNATIERINNINLDLAVLRREEAAAASVRPEADLLGSGAAFTASQDFSRRRQELERQRDLLRQEANDISRRLQARSNVAQPNKGKGLSYGGGDSAGTSSSKRLPASQKLVDLQTLLAERAGKVSKEELATLNYMIARQKILDNNLLPATDRESKLQAALAVFRKTIFGLREKETKEIEKQLEKQQKLQASFDKEIEDRKYKLGLISKDEYNQLLIRRERERLEKAYPGEEFAGKRKEAEALYQQEISPTPFQEMKQNIAQLKQELTDLLNPVNQITGAANAIGTAFSQSFASVINGSATAKEALASFFQNTANYFLDMAAQIIAKMIQMAILNTIVGLLPGGGGFNLGPASAAQGASYGGGAASGIFGGGDVSGFAFGGGGNFGGGFSGPKSDIQLLPFKPFAMGGIVDKPTMFAYANGGTGRFGLMGEQGVEAIMPLKRGPNGRLGVEASGGGTNVVVNVDASSSKAQGDQGNASALGRVIGAAVQAELIKQKRPGGLLA